MNLQEPGLPHPSPRAGRPGQRRPRRGRRLAGTRPGRKQRIVILVHERTLPKHRALYFVSQLAMLWAKRGIELRVMRGPGRRVRGDLLFVHVDLSCVPEEYLAITPLYRVSVNARARDIRKSTISRNLLGPDSDWEGPVIVKTDLNCAGVPEGRYMGTRGLGMPTRFKASSEYPIYPHRSEVPREFLRHPGLVVEKFLPEMEGGSYCLRSYNFLGEAEDCFRVYSESPIVNMASISRMEKIEVDPAIRTLRRELNFDYGKFDYVVHDGQAILLDANKTPGPLPIKDQDQMAMLRRRAEGIYGFLSRPE